MRETFDPLVDVAARRRPLRRASAARRAFGARALHARRQQRAAEIPLPGVGTVTELHARADRSRALLHVHVVPPAAGGLPLRSRRAERASRTASRGRTSSLARFETTQLFFTSNDGTRVPMFITARRGITLDGTHPTLLVGVRRVRRVADADVFAGRRRWLELGGDLRRGERARRRRVRTRVARRGDGRAQATVDRRLHRGGRVSDQPAIYACRRRSAVTGRGHRRPARRRGDDAAAGALRRRGDRRRLVRHDAIFATSPSAPSWTPEFGSPDRPADLRALLAYSPLQNLGSRRRRIRRRCSPPATMTRSLPPRTATSSPRNSKARAPNPGGSRCSGSTMTRASVARMPISKQIAASVDRLTFLVHALTPK